MRSPSPRSRTAYRSWSRPARSSHSTPWSATRSMLNSPLGSPIPNSVLASFANGVVNDDAAVAPAITQPWSNGQTEGQITKLKLVKRQMYGRAKLDLLHARLSVRSGSHQICVRATFPRRLTSQGVRAFVVARVVSLFCMISLHVSSTDQLDNLRPLSECCGPKMLTLRDSHPCS